MQTCSAQATYDFERMTAVAKAKVSRDGTRERTGVQIYENEVESPHDTDVVDSPTLREDIMRIQIDLVCLKEQVKHVQSMLERLLAMQQPGMHPAPPLHPPPPPPPVRAIRVSEQVPAEAVVAIPAGCRQKRKHANLDW